MSRRRVAAAILSLLIVLGASTASSSVAAAPNVYIVMLRTDVVDAAAVAAEHARRYEVRAKHVYEHALRGYAAPIPAPVLERLAEDPRVASVVPDGVVTTTALQPDPPWGLDRLDQRLQPLNGSYSFGATGVGVIAYVIDSGIRMSHVEFGGRASSGFDSIDGGSADDCFGHGTHVAATIGGASFGVAKNVRLKAVRVTNCNGAGTWSSVIAGVDWVTGHHRAGRPAVANMSLGGSFNSAMNSAVNAAIADGVHFVVAAGNSSADACRISPASVGKAITVAASTSNDEWAKFSNLGPCVDVVAPGVKVRSAWAGSDAGTATLTGTSMSAPHVAGVGARFLEAHPDATARQFTRNLFRSATQGVLRGVPPETSNKLLYADPRS